MKKLSIQSYCISIATILVFVISGFAHDKTTPRGSSVSHSHPADSAYWDDEPPPGYYDYDSNNAMDYNVSKGSWTVWALDQWEIAHNLTLISPSNTAFNCHAYAWLDARENDSGTWCWMSYSQASIFWNDGSYSEVCSSYATHVVQGDHSMVIINGDIVRSKWYKLPVFQHSYNSHYYDSSSKVFLRKNPEVPSDFTSIPQGLNDAKSGQIVHVDAGSDALTANITVQDNKLLQIHNNVSLGSYYITTSGTGQIEVDSGVEYIRIIRDSEIKYLCGTLTNACNNASSGDRIEIHGTHSISDNATVSSGVTLYICSGAILNFSSGKKLTINGTLTANGVTFQGSSWLGLEFSNASSSSQVINCTITDASVGINMYNSDVQVSGNTIEDNTTGILFNNGSDGSGIVNGNVVQNNSCYGIRCLSNSDPLIFSSNVITSNGDYGGIYGGVCGDGSSIFDLGRYSDQGHNSIYWNAVYEVATGYSGTIYARYNWWGDSDPSPFFYEPNGDVDWDYYLAYDPNYMLNKSMARNSTSSPAVVNVNVSDDTVGVKELDEAIFYYQNGKYDAAAMQFETIMNKYPDHFSGRRAMVFIYKCNKKMKTEEQNITLLNNVSTKYSNEEIAAVAKNLRTSDLIKQGDYPGAIEQCLAVTKSFSETEYNKYSLYDLGNIYWYYLNDPKTGETYYRQLIAQYPDDHLAISALATLGEWQPEEPKPEQQPLTDHTEHATFSLEQNYPNPFNPETTIRYHLAEAAHVTIKIYNLLGAEVITLIEQSQPQGNHAIQWHGRDRFGNTVANGVYWLRLQAGNFVGERKLVVVR
ncbi:MAG: right-handed parallel beta-helix repeat-containing protein [Candidatus Zhuqueibacterota bacterium]